MPFTVTKFMTTMKAAAIVEDLKKTARDKKLFGFYGHPALPTRILGVQAISRANPAVVTIPGHDLRVGDTFTVSGGQGMSELAGLGTRTVVEVIDENNFTMDIDTRTFGTYVRGATLSMRIERPSARNGLSCSDADVTNIWGEIMGMKRINPENIELVIPRQNWTSERPLTAYNMFECELNVEDKTCSATRVPHVDPWPIYVTPAGHVYLLLENGSLNQVSSIMPNSTLPLPFETSDGHRWQFLYSVNLLNDPFATVDYIPVRDVKQADGSDQWVTQAANHDWDGGVSWIEVIDPGEGYHPSNDNRVVFVGDGIGAVALPRFTNGGLRDCVVTREGMGYTQVDAYIEGPHTRPAQIRVHSQPSHGYARNAVFNAMPQHIMVLWDFDDDEGGNFMLNNSYYTYGLVYGIKTGIDFYANVNSYDMRYHLTLRTAPANFSVGSTIRTQEGWAVVTEIGGDNMNVVKVTRPRGLPFAVGQTVTDGVSVNEITAIQEPVVSFGSGVMVAYETLADPVQRNALQRERFRVTIGV